MATVRKQSAPAKATRAPQPPALSLVATAAPAPCKTPMHLPHGRAMSGQLMRALLAQYRTFRDVYDAWMRCEDDHGHQTDPVEVARQAELATLAPEVRRKPWPEYAWRKVLEHLAADMHVTLVRAVLLANGQLDDLADMDDDGTGLEWQACGVELDGEIIAIAPYVYDGESTGGTIDHRLEYASLVIASKANVVALGPAEPIEA